MIHCKDYHTATHACSTHGEQCELCEAPRGKSSYTCTTKDANQLPKSEKAGDVAHENVGKKDVCMHLYA